MRAKSLAAELDLRSGLGRAIGHSPEWTNVLKKATQVAATETTALVQGESGTGKEVVRVLFIARRPAKTVRSSRSIAPHCPSNSSNQSCLATSGVHLPAPSSSKVGQIELGSEWRPVPRRNHGDEPIGAGQVPAGSAGARVHAAGWHAADQGKRAGDCSDDRDLRKAVERSAFREDLYYRLQVFEIAIPPLRDRKSDVLPIAEAFLQDIARSFGRPRRVSRRTRSANYSITAGQERRASYATP